MASDPIRILILDDDEGVLIELEHLLEGEAYSTVTAWSAREAIALSERLRFHLVLVDEHLGDIDGLTLFNELWTKPAYGLSPAHAHPKGPGWEVWKFRKWRVPVGAHGREN